MNPTDPNSQNTMSVDSTMGTPAQQTVSPQAVSDPVSAVNNMAQPVAPLEPLVTPVENVTTPQSIVDSMPQMPVAPSMPVVQPMETTPVNTPQPVMSEPVVGGEPPVVPPVTQ